MTKLFVFKNNSDIEDILLDKVSLLSCTEKERLDKYKYKRDRVMSLAGRLMLFSFAKRYQNEEFKRINLIEDPEIFKKENIKEFPLFYGEYGKAYDREGKVFFNISHSKEYCVLALSDTEIGVDIQEIKEIRADIAKRFFEKRDNDYIEAAGADKTLRFIEVWCIKESYAKLTGKGISEGFSKFYENFEKMEIVDASTNEVKAELEKYEIDPLYCCYCARKTR